MPVERLAIVGTGLIGASVGLAAREAGVGEVRGWDVDPDALATASERGAVDAGGSLDEAVSGAALVVVAAPVARPHAPSAAPAPKRPPAPGGFAAGRRSRAAGCGRRVTAGHGPRRGRKPAHLGRHLPRQCRGAGGRTRRASAPDRAGGTGAR